MSRRPNGNGHDPNVLQFRPRPKPPKPSFDWKRPLGMFIGLFIAVAALEALGASFRGTGIGLYDLITAFAFATLVTGVYLYRRR